MITWLQRVLMKNGRWIFSILLVIIIVAFVFTINVAGGMGTSREGEAQKFYGVNFSSSKEVRALQREVELSNWLSTGRPPAQAADIMELVRRVSLRHLADSLHLPAPTEAQKVEFIRSRPLFRGPEGRFSQDAYQRFLDQAQTSPELTLDFVAHVLAEDYRLQRAEELLSGPGFVQDYEVRRMVEDMETKRTALVATVAWADFAPEIEVSDEALKAFYDSRPQSWGLPQQVEAQLLRFRANRFAGEVTPASEEELQQYFARNTWRFRARTPAPTLEGGEPETPAEPVLDDHRGEVARLVAEEKARALALKAADQFTMRLYRARVQKLGEELDALVAEAGAERIDLAVFSRGESPMGAPVPLAQPSLQQLFELPANRIFGDIVALPDGGGVLIVRKLIPARVRPLDEVLEQVEADYRIEERRRLFDEHGRALRDQLLAAVQAGEDFRAAAEAAGLSVTQHAGYTAREPAEDLEPAVGLALGRLRTGEITPMVIPAEGASGKLAYLAVAEAPAEEAVTSEIAMYRQQLLFFARRLAAQGLLDETSRAGSSLLR